MAELLARPSIFILNAPKNLICYFPALLQELATFFFRETAPLQDSANHEQHGHEGSLRGMRRKEGDRLKTLEVMQGRYGKTLPAIGKQLQGVSTFLLGLEQKGCEYNKPKGSLISTRKRLWNKTAIAN